MLSYRAVGEVMLCRKGVAVLRGIPNLIGDSIEKSWSGFRRHTVKRVFARWDEGSGNFLSKKLISIYFGMRRLARCGSFGDRLLALA